MDAPRGAKRAREHDLVEDVLADSGPRGLAAWRRLGVVEIETSEPSETCRCGRAIHTVHVFEHEDHGRVLELGSGCVRIFRRAQRG